MTIRQAAASRKRRDGADGQTMAQTVFLIDGTAFAYRAYYAVRVLNTSGGHPTNAVFGFATMLQALRDKEHPDAWAVGFDVGKPTFRHKQFEAYKEQRKPMPEPLIQQLPVIKRLLAAYRVPVFELEGFEAEDVLATVARQIAGPGIDVYLVTGDKDALQLVSDQVKVYNPMKDPPVLDAAYVKARYGVAPEQMVDLMALMGDQIDNIPGVPGIGEKTASQLIQRFGTLERLYAGLDQVTSVSQRESLVKAKAQVDLARHLATIVADVPVTTTLDALHVREPDWGALKAMFRELEFKRLLAAIDAKAPAVLGQAAAVTVVEDAASWAAMQSRLMARQGQATSFGCWPGAAGEVMVAWAEDETTAWVAQLNTATRRTTPGRGLIAWLEDDDRPKLAHDAKQAMRVLAQAGITLQGVRGDTMIAAYLINPARTAQTLADLVDELLGTRLPPVPEIVSEPSSDTLFSCAASPETEAAPAAPWSAFGEQACAVARTHRLLDERLTAAGAGTLYRDLELPLVRVLAQMEAIGIAINVPYLTEVRQRMDATLTGLTREILALAGTEFNLNSPKQLAQVLFERLGLPVIKRTKTGPSTDSDVLRQLAERHPLPKQLLQYRELSKLVSTYVEALPRLADPQTHRVHTSFNQAATATGRLSSSEPNLQNIPMRTELGRSIRKAFVPGIKDGVLIAADYSQIELRILAHLSGDAQLIEAFRQGRDIHRVTAALVYGLPEADVQPEQRYAMKAVNFGILYGMSAHGLSKELGIPREEAQTFIDTYFQQYPNVRVYLDKQIALAKQQGYVQTLLGRRRYIPEVQSPDPVIRQFGERMAVNAPVQGSAADLIKQAMVRLSRVLQDRTDGTALLLQVHDELVLEAPAAQQAAVGRIVRETMEGAMQLTVPLAVTVKAGPNWLELTEIDVV